MATDLPGTDYFFEQLEVRTPQGEVFALTGKVFLTWDGDQTYALDRTVRLSEISRVAPNLFADMPLEVFTQAELSELAELVRAKLNTQDLSEWLAEKTRY